LRNSAVLGISAVIVLGWGSLDREEVKTIVRISQMDRKPHWDIVLVQAPQDLPARAALRMLKDAGFTLVGLTAESKYTTPLWDVDLTLPRIGLVFGTDTNDGESFPDGADFELHVPATIPMREGTDDTLNLSNTVCAAAYERKRQLEMSLARRAGASAVEDRRPVP